MKAIITEDGYLVLIRGGRIKEQECPFSTLAGVLCGDWCPHFGDIEEDNTIKMATNNGKAYHLFLCHNKKLIFYKREDIIDDRKNH